MTSVTDGGDRPMIDTDRGYTITRVFDAPRELVWRAWTEPDRFAYWWGGADVEVVDVSLDVRPGGAWRATMILPDGTRIDWFGDYREVQEPERLVVAFTDGTGDEGAFDLFTVTLVDLGGKTEMTLRQSGGHLSDEEYEQAKAGTGTFLDTMAELLERG